MIDEPPADVEDELPVLAPAELLPGDVEVEDVVLVEALAPPPAAELVGVGFWGWAVCELVVECVSDLVVGLGVGVDEAGEVFQYVEKVVLL